MAPLQEELIFRKNGGNCQVAALLAMATSSFALQTAIYRAVEQNRQARNDIFENVDRRRKMRYYKQNFDEGERTYGSSAE